jgi:hypothetical protein
MSGRSIWARPLAGATRDGVAYYWATNTDYVPAWAAGMVALPMDTPPAIPASTVEPLGTLAADAVVSWAGPATLAAIAVAAPDLGITAQARRVGLLAGYVEAADDSIEVTGWTGTNGQLIQIGREVMTAGVIAGTTLPVTRTVRQDHATSLVRPVAVMRADRVPLVGQFVEVGVSEAGGDVVVWRGVMEAPTIVGATMRYGARPLTALVRAWRSVAPASLELEGPYSGRRANWQGREYNEAGQFTATGAVVWAQDSGEYPGLWPVVRIVGASGNWAMVSTTGADSFADAGRLLVRLTIDTRGPTEVIAVGTGDGVVRVSSDASYVRVNDGPNGEARLQPVSGDEAAQQIMRGQLAGVLREVEFCDLAVVQVGASVAAYIRGALGVGVLPASWAVGLPAAWIEDATLAEMQPVSYLADAVYMPGDSVLSDWLTAAVLSASGLYLTQDMGVLLAAEWEETARPMLGVELSVAEADDRGAWAWAGAVVTPLVTVRIDDPSTDIVQQTQISRDPDGYVRSARTRATAATSARLFLAADAWLDGAQNVRTVTARMGISASQIATQQSILATYSAQVPSVTIPARDVGRAVGYGVTVELPDAPTTRRTVGMVVQVARDLTRGVMTLTILLPGIGRETATFWAPGLQLSAVGSGTATASGDLGATYPATLAVYREDGTLRGQITGAALAVATLTWTGGVTPEDGDVVTLIPRTPVVALPGAAGVYGYIADVTPAEGDATWQ